MSPELRLILSCLRLSNEQQKRKEIDSRSPEAIDWGLFVNLADRHRVSPIVYKSLSHLLKSGVPASVFSDLKKLAQKNIKRIVIKTSELVHILNRFNQSDISALAFKGPVLSLLAYGDLSSRHVGDLDIMVAEDDVKKAEIVLLQEGYKRTSPDFGLTIRQNAIYKRNNSHFEYFCQNKGIKIELHYRCGHNRSLFPLKFDEAWEMRQVVQIGGMSISTFSLEHTLMLLCVHGAAHGWFRLFWLNDVSNLLARHPAIDWDKLVDNADRLGILRMAAESFIMAAFLFDSPLPSKLKKYGHKDKVVDLLVRTACDRIKFSRDYSSIPVSPDYVRKKLYDFNLRKDLRYKLEFILYQIGPSHDEWEAAKLPDLLFPLYFFIKPLTLLYRWNIQRKKISI